MRPLLALLAAALTFGAAPAGAEALRRVPTGHWVTSVRVNNAGPFEFIVDTAASSSAVFPNLRDRIALRNGARQEINGASGTQSFATVSLASLIVDGRNMRAVTALSLAGVPEDEISAGIIGADLLSRFVTEFDPRGGRLRLHEPGAVLPGVWNIVPFRLSGHRFVILDDQLDGRPVTMILDTGARRTIVNWAAASAAGAKPGGRGLTPDRPVQGATDHSTAAVRRDFRSLSAGPLRLRAASVTIADLPIFAELGLGARPAMILGVDRLQALRLVIDYPRRRLLFNPPA